MTPPASVLKALMQQLDTNQWLSPDEMQAFQLKQLHQLVEYLAKFSPHFKRRLAEAQIKPADLATPGGLAALPPLERRELQSVPDFFCTRVPPAHLPIRESKTSGSTGEPVVVHRTAVSQFGWLAMALRDHLWHGADFSQSLAAVRANISTVTRLDSWGAPASLLYKTGPSLGIPITSSAEEQFRLLSDFQPASLLIYPSSLNALLEYMTEQGAKLDSLSRVRTIGETVTPALRDRVQTVFQAKLTDTYSSQEVGYMALQCPGSDLYHTMGETVIVEVLDEQNQPCAQGQVGRVVVTDLHNFATPLVRYVIGDYAEVGPPCPCGRGLSTLKRVLGRQRNLILMPDGSRHWPLVGFDRFRDIAPIRQYQLIQKSRKKIDVRLSVDRPLTKQEEKALTEHICASLGHPFKISYDYYSERLPTGPSGKFEEFLCQV